MKPYALAIILCLTLIHTALAQPPPPPPTKPTRHFTPLPVDVEVLHVRLEGAFVLVTLAYHNTTATPLSIGLQQWANAFTRLGDDAHNSYTLLQTSGIGYGYDPRYWLTLDPQGSATAAFLFRAEDPAATPPTRFTFTSGQQLRSSDAPQAAPFTVSLPNLTPH